VTTGRAPRSPAEPSDTRLFGQREARLAALDRLPRNLWLSCLVNSQGALEPRLSTLAALRDALAAGTLPDAADAAWPDPDLAVPLAAILGDLGLPALCRDRPELAGEVVASMLWHLDRIVDYVDRGDDDAAARTRALSSFADDWKERCDLVDELVAVLGAADDLLKNTQWDRLRGLLKSDGWREIVRIRRLIEALPELSALFRRLGRALPADDSTTAQRVEPEHGDEATAMQAQIRTVRVPELPGETRDVRRSGRVARMLPSETMLLAHRRLRLVWHAHHAERSLLTYEEDERMEETVPVPVRVPQPNPQRRPERRLEAGPILLCVDTSGSMQGGAEAVAKAVVLEGMRTAHAQRRACHVVAFGGPDEIVELTLDPDVTGLERLADFMSQGFHGGTDICGPLERLLARIKEERWRQADLVIASDGEFGATPATAETVTRAKSELGLRIEGVLIGDRETIGLLELADGVFWVRDWRRYGGSNADSPVHSKSLTADYFPGALRTHAPGTTVGADAAARAVVPRGPALSAGPATPGLP
jgi:uncharacterized protein with von Willebrand factor type A (vWA) domain